MIRGRDGDSWRQQVVVREWTSRRGASWAAVRRVCAFVRLFDFPDRLADVTMHLEALLCAVH